jgi:2-oxoisovalerate dehydrogenase E1 component beta subunit
MTDIHAGPAALQGGVSSPAAPTATMVSALRDALRSRMEHDPRVLLMGEDIGRLGGVFRVTDGLQKDFGEDRVIDTPLGESGIVGTAIGLAMHGFRPVCEIQFDGFVYPAFDQIVSQLARLTYRSAGRLSMPVTIRIPYGGGIGAVEHHSESPEAYFAHTAGLKVVTCSHPHDAFWMLSQAIDSDDPVIFLEPKSRYWDKGVVDPRGPRGGLHTTRTVREGTDVTLACYGPTVATCLEAAEAAQEEGLASAEVMDLRSLSPLDLGPVVASVKRTGRLAVVHEAQAMLSVSAEVAAQVTSQAFYHMVAPVQRVTGFATPYPPSRIEHEYLPDVDRVLDAVEEVMSA